MYGCGIGCCIGTMGAEPGAARFLGLGVDMRGFSRPRDDGGGVDNRRNWGAAMGAGRGHVEVLGSPAKSTFVRA